MAEFRYTLEPGPLRDALWAFVKQVAEFDISGPDVDKLEKLLWEELEKHEQTQALLAVLYERIRGQTSRVIAERILGIKREVKNPNLPGPL